MPRSVNHVASKARRKNVMKHAKGYFGRRKNVWTVAKNAVEKGWEFAYTGRKQKKRNFRSLWITRINAGARQHGMSYSQFIGLVNKSEMELNRKVLADLAMNHPDAFKAVVDSVKK
ncbi:MAG: 50S ribosomal protein L20 [Crocinitomicaceae bacterium]|nr:50S ribosomal protein L20 [Crocinitomicaceae bacterium]MDG1659219.1 50S ribosomal protein L20 [Crocinitomicaceae bacterium]